MAEITLTELFPGATQDLTTITIPKSAFTGLTPLAVNKGDQILAAILIRSLTVYPLTKRGGNPTATPPVAADLAVSITVELGQRSIATDFETGTEYQEQGITARLYKLLPSSTLDPDDY
jgi:hypothetical protein